MGTLIDMVAIATPYSLQPGLKHNSSQLAANAAINCIKKATLDPDRIEVLINTGIYRTDNIGEPAMAAIIQNLIKTYPFKSFKKNSHYSNQTFSFDLINGGCGFINAIQLIDGMIFTKSVRTGIIVTADVEPIPDNSDGYNFTPVAAAVILSSGEKDRGFIHFKCYTYLEYQNYFTGQLIFVKSKQKSRLVIKQAEKYLQSCIKCVKESIEKFLEEIQLSIYEINLVISSQTPSGLPNALASIPGLKGKVVIASVESGELHTAGLAYALQKTWNSALFLNAKNILFVTVSAGITTSIALYRK